jgi:hypothetical protein
MKISKFLVVLCLVVLSVTMVAQNKTEEPKKDKAAHETVIDGRWEAKPNPDKDPIIVFEFKNEAGVVTGMVIQDGKSNEIQNGTLEGTTLKFETTLLPAGGGDPVKMMWTGELAHSAETITVTCVPEAADGKLENQRAQFEVKRVKK